jgi:hypothetical protein
LIGGVEVVYFSSNATFQLMCFNHAFGILDHSNITSASVRSLGPASAILPSTASPAHEFVARSDVRLIADCQNAAPSAPRG